MELALQDNNNNVTEGHTRGGWDYISTCTFTFRTPDDLSAIMRSLTDMFTTHTHALTGIHALALNAIEHGNLEIGYLSKAEYLEEGSLQENIQTRLNDPAYAARMVEMTLTREEDGLYVVITDQGPGFDWKNYINIDPARAGQKHGRGIALAKSLSFEKITYNEAGNQVIGKIRT